MPREDLARPENGVSLSLSHTYTHTHTHTRHDVTSDRGHRRRRWRLVSGGEGWELCCI